VVAGLLIGDPGRAHVMSDATREHLDSFWELIDESLNAVLFVLSRRRAGAGNTSA
jgi:CPA1 family monovalent cation:H+ antiporter